MSVSSKALQPTSILQALKSAGQDASAFLDKHKFAHRFYELAEDDTLNVRLVHNGEIHDASIVKGDLSLNKQYHSLFESKSLKALEDVSSLAHVAYSDEDLMADSDKLLSDAPHVAEEEVEDLLAIGIGSIVENWPFHTKEYTDATMSIAESLTEKEYDHCTGRGGIVVPLNVLLEMKDDPKMGFRRCLQLAMPRSDSISAFMAMLRQIYPDCSKLHLGSHTSKGYTHYYTLAGERFLGRGFSYADAYMAAVVCAARKILFSDSVFSNSLLGYVSVDGMVSLNDIKDNMSFKKPVAPKVAPTPPVKQEEAPKKEKKQKKKTNKGNKKQ